MELVGNAYKMGDLNQILKLELSMAINKATSLVPVVVGDPGTGKSQMLLAMARAMNFEPIIISGGTLALTTCQVYQGLSILKLTQNTQQLRNA